MGKWRRGFWADTEGVAGAGLGHRGHGGHEEEEWLSEG